MGGQPVATMGDQFPIAGCPFQVPVGADRLLLSTYTAQACRAIIQTMKPILIGEDPLAIEKHFYNMTGVSPRFTLDEMRAMGIAVCISPNAMLRSALGAMHDLALAIGRVIG